MSGGGRRATGAWLPGDPPGRRQFAQLFTDRPLQLDLGGQLGPITLAYESWGQLNSQRSNGVLLLHGFSGDSHAAGPAEAGHPSPGWWDAMVGPGRPVDTQRFFVVCPNALGGCQGSTAPVRRRRTDGPMAAVSPHSRSEILWRPNSPWQTSSASPAGMG